MIFYHVFINKRLYTGNNVCTGGAVNSVLQQPVKWQTFERNLGNTFLYYIIYIYKIKKKLPFLSVCQVSTFYIFRYFLKSITVNVKIIIEIDLNNCKERIGRKF